MSEHADQFEEREERDVGQSQQKKDLGSGGGEVDDETTDEPQGRSGEGGDEPGDDQPWAKASSGDADDI